MDTIFALSSGPVPSGLAVVRVSGPLAAVCLQALCGSLPEPRRAELRVIKQPADGSILDQGLVLWFPSPRSYTGQDVAEFHLHGGRAVVQAMIDALAGKGARYAEAGEFSRRAFLNGKLDLTQVEGLADLLAADTESQRIQAVAQVQGALAQRAEGWRAAILGLRAEIEARLDFSDEGDVPDALPGRFWSAVDEARQEMEQTLAEAESGIRTRDGFRVAILGRPNAGKSSLLNVLSRQDIAIVTEEPGTTRDILEVPLDLDGRSIVLFDTAGLRETTSVAEREGVRRSITAAGRADLVLWLEDCRNAPEPIPLETPAQVWRVRTKVDLRTATEGDDLMVSALSGAGIPRLIECLKTSAEGAQVRCALITRHRQQAAVQDAASALASVRHVPEDVAADLLRSAGDAIGRLTGRIGVEDVLDRLFGEFCIGK